MINTLAYSSCRSFKICSGWTKVYEELNFLKRAINKLVIKPPQLTTVREKTLILSLPYLEDISLQTRTKLRKSFKDILNCCNL